MKNLVNVTPHTLNIIIDEENTLTLQPSGTVARVETVSNDLGKIEGVPLYQTTFGDLVDLPKAKLGTYYVASLLVASAAAKIGRIDVYSPGQLVRDEDGKPIGCKGLSIPA